MGDERWKLERAAWATALSWAEADAPFAAVAYLAEWKRLGDKFPQTPGFLPNRRSVASRFRPQPDQIRLLANFLEKCGVSFAGMTMNERYAVARKIRVKVAELALPIMEWPSEHRGTTSDAQEHEHADDTLADEQERREAALRAQGCDGSGWCRSAPPRVRCGGCGACLCLEGIPLGLYAIRRHDRTVDLRWAYSGAQALRDFEEEKTAGPHDRPFDRWFFAVWMNPGQALAWERSWRGGSDVGDTRGHVERIRKLEHPERGSLLGSTSTD